MQAACIFSRVLPVGLVSPSIQTGGNFGSSVAISGSMTIVGAPFETVSGLTGAGQVYIVDSATDTIANISSPNKAAAGGFGYSVAISGTTVIVGAPFETVSGSTNAGHAYVFSTLGKYPQDIDESE